MNVDWVRYFYLNSSIGQSMVAAVYWIYARYRAHWPDLSTKSTCDTPEAEIFHLLFSFYQGDLKYAREKRPSCGVIAVRIGALTDSRIASVARVLPVVVFAGVMAGCTVYLEPALPSQVIVEADRATQVHLDTKGNLLLLDVTSERGIGHADVRLAADHTFKAIEFRLHLRGLEQFVLSHGQEEIVVSASGDSFHQVRTVTRGNVTRHMVLAEGSPQWLDVQQIAPEVKEDRNARPGIFVVHLSNAGNLGRAFTIRWVDFFR